MYSPIPPCCRFDPVHEIMEDSAPCRYCGACGFHSCLKWRERVMIFATIVSFIGIVLQLFPVIAYSENIDINKRFAWTYGDVKSRVVYPPAFLNHLESQNVTLGKVNWSNAEDVYIGLKGFVLCDEDDNCDFETWDGGCQKVAQCDLIEDFFPPEYSEDCGSYCDKCRDANGAVITVTILGFVTAFPQMFTDIQRSTWMGDLNCQKVMGIVTGCLGFFSTLAALTGYVEACGRELPHKNGALEVDWRPGGSWFFILFAILLKPLDVCIHCAVPTPLYKRQEGYNGWADPPDGEWDLIKKRDGDSEVEITDQ